jgi:hypothetical protein
VYGAVPPVADTVTEVVPPKQLITGAVDEAVGKAFTVIVIGELVAGEAV